MLIVLDKAAAVAHYKQMAEDAAKYREEHIAEKANIGKHQSLARPSSRKERGGAVAVETYVYSCVQDPRCIHCRRIGHEHVCDHVLECQFG